MMKGFSLLSNVFKYALRKRKKKIPEGELST